MNKKKKSVHGDVVEKELVEENVMAQEISQDEFKRLTEVMFPKWATKISKFLQDLDPHKTYTMKQYCIHKSIGEIIHLTKKRVGKTNGYGEILQKKQDVYCLYNELIPAFLKYF